MKIYKSEPYRFLWFKWRCKIHFGKYTVITINAKTEDAALGIRDRIYDKLNPEISKL